MRFLRHLGVVTAVVAIVVVLGLAWAHFGPQTLVPSSELRFQKEVSDSRPGGEVLRRVVRVQRGQRASVPAGIRISRNGSAEPFNLGLGSMFDPVNLPVLRHTLVIEGGVIAAVVIIDRLRRRSRRAWRAQQLAAETYRPEDES